MSDREIRTPTATFVATDGRLYKERRAVGVRMNEIQYHGCRRNFRQH